MITCCTNASKANKESISQVSTNEGRVVSIPDTLGDSLIWGAYEGPLPKNRIEQTNLSYGEFNEHVLCATTQTTQGLLCVKFIEVGEELVFFSNKVDVQKRNGKEVNIIEISIKANAPDIVYCLWHQNILSFDVREAKRIILVQIKRRI